MPVELLVGDPVASFLGARPDLDQAEVRELVEASLHGVRGDAVPAGGVFGAEAEGRLLGEADALEATDLTFVELALGALARDAVGS